MLFLHNSNQSDWEIKAEDNLCSRGSTYIYCPYNEITKLKSLKKKKKNHTYKAKQNDPTVLIKKKKNDPTVFFFLSILISNQSYLSTPLTQK